ncbi:MAG: hypothetical protein FWE05_00410 [Defluviitaleaceae bacterium]|nr:hypothetical protein [Defluviitaleaceae bacterium]
MKNSKKNLKKIISSLKSICIIALAGLAVYQISQLWFVNLTNRNFFLYLEARFPPAVPDGRSAWAQPFRIVYGAGDGRFNIRYSDIETSDAWEFGANTIEAIFHDGHFVGTVEIANPAGRFRIQSRPVFIYEYAFSIDAETFAMSMGRRNGTALTNHGVMHFNSIAVQPSTTTDTNVRVFFMDGINAWEFSIAPGGRNHPIENFTVYIPPIKAEDKHFVAVGNDFAPRAEVGFNYYSIESHNPHLAAHGDPTFSSIRAQIGVFFSNPATMNQFSGVDGVYTFTGQNTTVRYLPFDVLEYRSYRSAGRTAPGNLLSDFSAALAFINADPNVINETFLMDYDVAGTAHVFYFGLTVGDFPLWLEYSWYTGPNCREPLTAPIEVTVDHGRVVHYRRLAHYFHIDELSWFDMETLDIEEAFALGFPIVRGQETSLQPFIAPQGETY